MNGPRYVFDVSAAELVTLIDVIDDYLRRTPNDLRNALELADMQALRDRAQATVPQYPGELRIVR